MGSNLGCPLSYFPQSSTTSRLGGSKPFPRLSPQNPVIRSPSVKSSGFLLKDSVVLGILSLLGLAFLAAIVLQQRDRAFRGVNDFIPLYSGAWLVHSGDLYDNAELQQISREKTGMWSREHGYIRLPFHAALLWPLTRLPYIDAYYVWQALSLAAAIGFLVLWRPPAWPVRLLFATLSIPLLHAWLKGQDIPFVLLFLAVTLRLHQSGKPKLAGLVFSLCAIKFHLFLLTPVLIVGRRYWSFAGGFLAGGALLAVISFAAAGWSWPLAFLASATNPAFSPGVSAMPNLHGALSELPFSLPLEALLSMTVILAAWVAARRASFEYAFACSLAGGLLLSHHAYLLDSAVLLPACLTVLACFRAPLAERGRDFPAHPPGPFPDRHRLPLLRSDDRSHPAIRLRNGLGSLERSGDRRRARPNTPTRHRVEEPRGGRSPGRRLLYGAGTATLPPSSPRSGCSTVRSRARASSTTSPASASISSTTTPEAGRPISTAT